MNNAFIRRAGLWAVLLGAVAAALLAALTGVLGDYDLPFLREHAAAWRAAAADAPLRYGAAYILLYAGVVGLSLPVATLLTLAAGYVFGLVAGTIIVVIGATLGATAVFVVARGTMGAALRARAAGLHDRIAAAMARDPVGYMLFLRLVPLFPFVLVNIAPALAGVSLRVFVLTTFFGIIPGTAVYVNVGRALATIADPGDIMGAPVILALSLLGLCALVPALYRRIRP